MMLKYGHLMLPEVALLEIFLYKVTLCIDFTDETVVQRHIPVIKIYF